MNISIKPSEIETRTIKSSGRCVGAIATHKPTGLKAYTIGRYKHSSCNMAVNHLLAAFARQEALQKQQKS
ncbi:MAG: hypothetical protein HRU20_22470 [Pseudomonadales bacterium]|nr:hypothetical protein [Pseudomonadales bacterium]